MGSNVEKRAIAQLCRAQIAHHRLNLVQTLVVVADQLAPAIDPLVEVIEEENPLKGG